MKKISGITFLFLLVLSGLAQIPNNSFENWTTVGSYLMPDQWDNLNPSTAGTGVFTCTKGTPGNPGNSYLKLTSKTVTGMGVVPGIATCGVLDQITHLPVSGFAFNQRPQNFTGKWQYMIYGIKPGYIDVALTRWDASAGTRVVVASLHKVLTGMVMSWGSFSVPLVYQDGQYPDSCTVFLSASGTSAANNDYLYLDNLQFQGTVTAVEPGPSAAAGLKVFPNPANDSFTIRFIASETGLVPIRLFDLNGRLVFEQKVAVISGENRIRQDVRSIPSGLYLLVVGNSSPAISSRIVIR